MERAAKISVSFLLIAALFLTLYWAKCQNRIDILKTFKLERYLPLDFLQRKVRVVSASKEGYLIRENFERGSLLEWSPWWSRSGKGRVVLRSVDAAHGRSAVIEHPGDDDWSFQYVTFFEAALGQELRYRLSYKADRPATAGMVLYDAQKNVLNWFYESVRLPVSSGWSEAGRSFTIPPEAKYACFRVTGLGVNKIYLDDIYLERV